MKRTTRQADVLKRLAAAPRGPARDKVLTELAREARARMSPEINALIDEAVQLHIARR